MSESLPLTLTLLHMDVRSKDKLVVLSAHLSQDFGESCLHGARDFKQDDVHHLKISKAIWENLAQFILWFTQDVFHSVK